MQLGTLRGAATKQGSDLLFSPLPGSSIHSVTISKCLMHPELQQ